MIKDGITGNYILDVGQAGELTIEVTEEMIEAGAARFFELRPDVNVGGQAMRDLLAEVVSTMLAAEHSHSGNK
jgi:hypothetical protein